VTVNKAELGLMPNNHDSREAESQPPKPMTQIAHYARPLWSRCFSSVSVAADVTRGELGRFYVKQTESGPRSPFADVSDEELAEFIRTNAADVLEGLDTRKAPP